MKLTEAIAQLTELNRELGDVELVVWDSEWAEYLQVDGFVRQGVEGFFRVEAQ